MKNKLLTISKIGLLAFTILVSQACQEDYEMVDPPMITDYDDDLDEEVVLQKGLESYFVTQFGEGSMWISRWESATLEDRTRSTSLWTVTMYGRPLKNAAGSARPRRVSLWCG